MIFKGGGEFMKQEKFLTQSYKDAWNDYEFSVKNIKSPHWDWIVITASNEHQADSYRIQIKRRQDQKMVPLQTKFAVVADPDGERVGSGGATLNVLKFISEHVGIKNLDKQKILIIHSGGDSKRIPQYSACGKLFSPIPRVIFNKKTSTIFDELLISVSGIPARIEGGMLIMPGDTQILYNPIQLDLMSCDAAGLSIKARITEGKDHGVFLNGHDNKIAKFLHKKSENCLRKLKAVDEDDNVDIDTGCIWLGSKVVRGLFNLISNGEIVDEIKFRKFVNNKVCLSFYGDFIYPLASDVTIEEYLKQEPESGYSNELNECRLSIWEELNKFSLKLIRMMPAKYIHYGTTHELFDLRVNNIDKHSYLGWEKQILCNIDSNNIGVVFNSFIDPNANISKSSYIENSIVGPGTEINNRTILSGVTIKDIIIPQNIVLHCLKLKNGKFVCRIYGIDDNPKESADGTFLGTTLKKIMNFTGLRHEDFWENNYASIWNAKIYSECESVEEACKMALLLLKIANGTATDEEIFKWKKSNRYSLKDSFYIADIQAALEWQEHVEDIVRVDKCVNMIKENCDMNKALSVLKYSNEEFTELEMLYKKAEISAFPINMRLYLALSKICKDNDIKINFIDSIGFEDKSYEVISSKTIDAMKEKHEFDWFIGKFIKEAEVVELPVRVNFCGSPSDAAPYCLEHGGTMLNGSLLLRNKLPIHVEVKRLNKCCIEFESMDLKAAKTFYDINELRNCSNPSDIFALHKAVLVATGVVPLDIHGITLEYLCERLGGGIYMSTSVDIPKGSGLGTSSILAAACVKAINSILNQDISNERIYSQVFAVEQLMTTGGGWQDQVGGFTNGLKFIHTDPGIYQNINVDYINLKKEFLNELNERFVLIFSGQRRLARNVLREEMNQCIRNDKKSLEAIDEVRKICVLMKFELERGNITEFGRYLTEQFNLVKQLDKGASNTCIEYIFDVCEDLIDGKSICGAGGGGFLQVILKKGVSKDILKKRINDEFKDCGIEVWDSTLI